MALVIPRVRHSLVALPGRSSLLPFAGQFSRQPADIVREDFETVRQAGWSNEEITESVLVASLYACANRFSAAIGLVADF
jgi:alkylhydroperoxidase family enzyme